VATGSLSGEFGFVYCLLTRREFEMSVGSKSNHLLTPCRMATQKKIDATGPMCDSVLAETKMNEPKSLSRLLKVLSVETRVRMVQLLKGRALCVNALASRLDVTQGAVSQHLRIMRDAGLVIDEKRGYFVHYRLNEETLAAWRKEIDRLLDPTHGASTDTKGAPKCAAMRVKKAARGRRT
jgi:DNA-binding transcriptional ArsR family regulator